MPILPAGDANERAQRALDRLCLARGAAEAERAAAAGLPKGALAVLEPLADALALPAGELARRSGFGPSALSHALRRLERDGLIERDRQRGDARVVLVRLTREGRRSLQRARLGQQRLAEALAERFSTPDLHRLADDLEEVAAALEGMPPTLAPAPA